MSDAVWPHRRQPTRLPRPWDSLGKNTGVGCHFLLQCMKVKSESEVAQLCPTRSNPKDCSLPGSSVHGIFQARVLEWGAIAFSIGILYEELHIHSMPQDNQLLTSFVFSSSFCNACFAISTSMSCCLSFSFSSSIVVRFSSTFSNSWCSLTDTSFATLRSCWIKD